MNWLQSIIYGIVSGLSEFLPVSSEAHQRLMLHLFGIESKDPVMDLLVHISVLAALILSFKGILQPSRRPGAAERGRKNAEGRYLKNAMIPLFIFYFAFRYIVADGFQLPIVALFVILNGILLYLPSRMMSGDRDIHNMSFLDSLLIGFAGALSAFPGISPMAAMTTAALARGSDKRKTISWALRLCIPLLIASVVVDIISIGSGNFTFATNFIGYFLAMVFSFAFAYAAIGFVVRITDRTAYNACAFYCWGMALLTFILYLIVV